MATEQPTVTYKPVPGFPGYRVGDDGSVWTCRHPNGTGHLLDAWCRLKPDHIKQGHLQVSLFPGRVRRRVHQLVLLAFVGPCPDGLIACHNDGNPANNALANLRWDTPASNYADRDRHGRTARGERINTAKLTPEAVIAMRAEYAAGGVTQKQLASRYGVCHANVSFILSRKHWRHV